MQGYKVHYVPGWDCHGLPIELKVLTNITEKLKPQEIRKKGNQINSTLHHLIILINLKTIIFGFILIMLFLFCFFPAAREFAEQTVQKQKQAFKSWGVLGDWENSYMTCRSSYIENQMEQFYNLYESGLVFRDIKPVYWSPSSRYYFANKNIN